MQILPELQHALRDASYALDTTSSCWLIGGSCGLLLQNVHLDNSPSDIDIYTDLNSVSELHLALTNWSVDGPELSITERYRSVLSHYQLEDYTLELVAGFEVQTGSSRYIVEVDRLLAPAHASAELDELRLPLMPLSHELIFNLLRDRTDRYEAIAAVMKEDITAHLPLMEQLLASSEIHRAHVLKLSELLDHPPLQKYAVNSSEKSEEREKR